MAKLILLRHGQSVWNLENIFTGWIDVELSPKGREEAVRAGELLKNAGIKFDIAYTSYLKRAIDTLHLAAKSADLEWVQEIKTWRLNERHYGALQGLNKAETAKKYGDEQVHIWRRSFDTPPPLMSMEDANSPFNEPKYALLMRRDLPLGESLKMTIGRVIPFWNSDIKESLAQGKDVLISAHGNSLRGLLKHIENIDDQAISSLEIPTGVPQVLELDSKTLVLQDKYYL